MPALKNVNKAHLDDGLPADAFLDERDEVLEQEGPPVAQVDHLVAQRPVHRRHHPCHDVVDVGVVARGGAVPVLLDGVPAVHAVDKLEGRHVGTPPGTIHCEESQPSAV